MVEMNPYHRPAKAAYRPLGRFIPNPKLKLQEQLAEVCRFQIVVALYSVWGLIPKG